MTGKLVKLRIREGRFVYVDGELRRPGDIVAVSSADAKALVDQGDAEKAK